MCEALAARQQQRIKWDVWRHCQAQKGVEAGKEGEVMAYVVGLHERGTRADPQGSGLGT